MPHSVVSSEDRPLVAGKDIFWQSPAQAGARNQLVCVPDTYDFGAGEYDGLLEHVQQVAAQTVLATVNDPRTLYLDDLAVRPDGLKYAPLALKQICNLLASGLWPLIMDLSGYCISRQAERTTAALLTAIRIFNATLRSRFGIPKGINGRGLSQNFATRTVDGVVGPRYRYLPHEQLLAGILQGARELDKPLAFRNATVTGRRLSALFVHEQPIFTLPGDRHLYCGIYAGNSEAGECSVRLALAVQFAELNWRCLGRIRHIAHSGKRFLTSIRNVISSLISGWGAHVERVVAGTRHLSEPLQLVTGDAVDEEKRRALILRLRRFVPNDWAQHIVQRTLYADTSDDTLASESRLAAAARRTRGALLFATLFEGRKQYHNVRELLERAAFEILVGTLRVT